MKAKQNCARKRKQNQLHPQIKPPQFHSDHATTTNTRSQVFTFHKAPKSKVYQCPSFHKERRNGRLSHRTETNTGRLKYKRTIQNTEKTTTRNRIGVCRTRMHVQPIAPRSSHAMPCFLYPWTEKHIWSVVLTEKTLNRRQLLDVDFESKDSRSKYMLPLHRYAPKPDCVDLYVKVASSRLLPLSP